MQLGTKTKMFCSCDNTGDQQAPNTTICPVCTGQPGTLPVPNSEALHLTALAALAFGSTIPSETHFERKHYFYPDLPKGYQISQTERPMGMGGQVDLRSRGIDKVVRLDHLHLEEDAAKLFHVGDSTGVDFNRGGTPLVEIVSMPDMETPAQAKVYLQEIRLLARYLGLSEADMEKGHLRCDASISVRPEGQEGLNPRTEIKNLNSFRAVERALQYEEKLLTELLEAGEYPESSSTKSWDEEKGVTKMLRSKESSADYRYLPEPDIPPIVFTAEDVEELRGELIELPWNKRDRFIHELKFKPDIALQLVDDRDMAAYAEEVVSELQEWGSTAADSDGSEESLEQVKVQIAKVTGNWITGELQKLLKSSHLEIKQCKITPDNFAEFLTLILQRRINNTQGQQLLGVLFERGGEPHALLAELDMSAMEGGENALGEMIDAVLAENPAAVADIKAGKQNAVMFLVGQVMKKSKGKADAQMVKDLVIQKIHI